MSDRSFCVETYVRRRVALGYARVEFDEGKAPPLAALTASVPCGGCTACCRGLPVELADREPDAGLSVETVNGVRRLRQTADGSCVHLIDGQCSVYDRRPLSCRAFDCRDYSVARVAPVSHPLLAAAVARWRPEVKSRKDRQALERIPVVTRALVEAGRFGLADAIATAMILRRLPTAEALRLVGLL